MAEVSHLVEYQITEVKTYTSVLGTLVVSGHVLSEDVVMTEVRSNGTVDVLQMTVVEWSGTVTVFVIGIVLVIWYSFGTA